MLISRCPFSPFAYIFMVSDLEHHFWWSIYHLTYGVVLSLYWNDLQ